MTDFSSFNVQNCVNLHQSRQIYQSPIKFQYPSPFQWKFNSENSSVNKSFGLSIAEIQMMNSPRTDRLEKCLERIEEYKNEGRLNDVLITIEQGLQILKNDPYHDHEMNQRFFIRFQVRLAQTQLELNMLAESYQICDQGVQALTQSDNQVAANRNHIQEFLIVKASLMLIHGDFNQVNQIINEIESLGDICDDHINLKLAMIKYELLLAQNDIEQAINYLIQSINTFVNVQLSLVERAFLKLLELHLNLMKADHNQRVKAAQLNYELFKISREMKDVHKSMNYINQAVELDPQDWTYQFELALFIKQALKLRQDASVIMKKVLDLNPANSKVWFEAACLAEEMTEYEQAREYLDKAVSIDPYNVEIHNKISQIQYSLKRYPEAIQSLENAIQIYHQDQTQCQHNLSILLGNLGMIYSNLNENEKAYTLLQQSIQCNNDNLHNWLQLAVLEMKLGKYDNSMNICERVLSFDHTNEKVGLKCSFPKAFELKGDLFKCIGQFDQAFLFYSKAIEVNPESHSANSSIADLYRNQGKLKEAIDYYKKALSVKLDLTATFAAMCNAKQFCCDWDQADDCFQHLYNLVSKQMEAGELPCVDPFSLFMYNFTPEQKYLVTKRYADHIKTTTMKNLHAQGVTFHGFQHQKVNPDHQIFKIRLGYVSWDFADHPLAQLMQSIFAMHDRSRFHVVAFSLRKNDGSEWRQRIESGCDEFYEIPDGMSTVDLSNFIYGKSIHILFNLNGWTQGHRSDVFVLRPAPIQISYMGFCGSMGADYIDYIITDEIATPPECLKRFYAEKAIYMPHSYFVNDYMQSSPYTIDPNFSRSCRRQFGLPEDKFIFANFNQLYKLDQNTYTVWMNILKRVPNSVLWVLEYPADAKENLLKEAENRGVNSNRIIMTTKVPKHQHIERCHLADLSLDNPITNGHTTTCDLLWSGLPVITYPISENMPSRVAASICYALECPEMVVHSYQEYEELSVKLATSDFQKPKPSDNIPLHLHNKLGSLRLKQLRAKIERNRQTTPLFNTKLWVQHMEVGLLKAWSMYNSTGSVDNIKISELLANIKNQSKSQPLQYQ